MNLWFVAIAVIYFEMQLNTRVLSMKYLKMKSRSRVEAAEVFVNELFKVN
jgi:hypothetical protein